MLTVIMMITIITNKSANYNETIYSSFHFIYMNKRGSSYFLGKSDLGVLHILTIMIFSHGQVTELRSEDRTSGMGFV